MSLYPGLRGLYWGAETLMSEHRLHGAHRVSRSDSIWVAVMAVGLALALTATMLALSTANTTTAAVAATGSCKDIYFVSLRGSGETAKNGDDQQASPRTLAVFNGLKTELARTGKSQDLEFTQLAKYTAPSVDKILEGIKPPPVLSGPAAGPVIAAWATYTLALILKVNLLHYLSGELDGETELITALTNIRDTCKKEGKTPDIFIAGYSQGAMAAHSVLYRLDQSNSSLASTITGTALIADPFRVSNSNLKNFGSAPRNKDSWGICHALGDLPGNSSCRPGQLPSTAIPVPQRFTSSTFEVCDSGDIVCDTSKILRTPRLDQVVQNARSVHTACPGSTYCGDESKAAGKALAGLSKKTSAPGSGSLPGPVVAGSARAGYAVSVTADKAPLYGVSDVALPSDFDCRTPNDPRTTSAWTELGGDQSTGPAELRIGVTVRCIGAQATVDLFWDEISGTGAINHDVVLNWTNINPNWNTRNIELGIGKLPPSSTNFSDAGSGERFPGSRFGLFALARGLPGVDEDKPYTMVVDYTGPGQKISTLVGARASGDGPEPSLLPWNQNFRTYAFDPKATADGNEYVGDLSAPNPGFSVERINQSSTGAPSAQPSSPLANSGDGSPKIDFTWTYKK